MHTAAPSRGSTNRRHIEGIPVSFRTDSEEGGSF